MNSRNNLNLGDEIKNIVQNALNNKDFNELNRDVGNVVKDALAEAKSSVNWKPGNQNNRNEIRKNKKTYIKEDQNVRNLQAKPLVKNNSKIAVRRTKYKVPVGQVTGVLFTVLGTIGSAGFGIALFVLTLLGLTIGNFVHTVSIFLLPLFLFSLFLLINGHTTRKRLQRFNKYSLCMGNRDYCGIDELADLTGFSNKFIEKDLRKMISNGMFPEGHIDNKKTTFILTNERYKQYLQVRYLEVQQNIAKKGLKEEEKQKILNSAQEFEKKSDGIERIDPELKKSLDEGRRYISDIKAANVAIPGEKISQKLDRLEIVVGKIFDYVEVHPEKLVEIKKFTEYFLPTTFKLVDAYKKLDDQAIQGDNISNAKREIEDTMDTINLAFENLLDDLFHDISMDISTDISVLETMFAQEGLTQNNIKSRNNSMEEEKNE